MNRAFVINDFYGHFAFQGKAVGVAIGCLLGMFPLLFLKDKLDQDKE